jgi:hypothetical protein
VQAKLSNDVDPLLCSFSWNNTNNAWMVTAFIATSGTSRLSGVDLVGAGRYYAASYLGGYLPSAYMGGSWPYAGRD